MLLVLVTVANIACFVQAFLTMKKTKGAQIGGENASLLPKKSAGGAAMENMHSTAGGTRREATVYLMNSVPISRRLLQLVKMCIVALIMVVATLDAYNIRLHPINVYGKVIHEFDPWFNYRATEYLDNHGWHAFFHWYDYMSWYPIGRPVGTTIFPGMQLTSVAIRRMLAMAGVNMSLNDICVYVPAWFGSVSTVLAALIAYETSGSAAAAAATATLFAVVPAHLMRSMAGEYDNECVAMAAMLLTFYMWLRSLRNAGSWPIGVLTGAAYGYMVSTWGGFVFVLNMIALHAAASVLVDWLRGIYDANMLKAYSLFYVVGTAIATCVPPVGWAPFTSLEQLMALLVFIFMWALHFSEQLRLRAGAQILSYKTLQIRARVFMITFGILIVASVILAPRGYFGPISSRVLALFVKHTRTGNPLVDSVAEHFPSSSEALFVHLHICLWGWAIGFLFTCVFVVSSNSRGGLFLILYSVASYYFALKMSRLLLLTAPVAGVLSGNAVGCLVDLVLELLFVSPEKNSSDGKQNSKTRGKKQQQNEDPITMLKGMLRRRPWLCVAVLGSLLGLTGNLLFNSGYRQHCDYYAKAASSPQIMYQAQLSSGQIILVDDYYVSYLWLRNHTPEDARVLAWWDYGYQITGISNRTSLADGNTCNHEHIATIGKLLTSPVAKSHSLIRHLADYVLIWSGQQMDDLMKSPHMARIGNSVFRDICPEDDPLCSTFGFFNNDFGQPTPMMRDSLLYNLHISGEAPGVEVDRRMFRLVYKSRYGLVKIFKVMNVSAESKAWVRDPKNRKCDAPGSWLCPGQYPPAKEIQDMLAKRINYRQITDFNSAGQQDAYYRAYMRQFENNGV